jgi:hypothetical protein
MGTAGPNEALHLTGAVPDILTSRLSRWPRQLNLAFCEEGDWRSVVDAWHSQWLSAIRAMTATTDDAVSFLDRRLRFTTAVARRLSHDDPQLDSLVYGVWLQGHASPV